MRRQWRNPEYREKITATSTARFAKQTKKNWQNKNSRQKYLKHLSTFSKAPVQRKANSKRMKKLWADPAYRKKMVRVRKHSYTDERNARAVASRKANNPDLVPWNKGLTKNTDKRLMASSKRLMGHIPEYGKYRAWYRSPKRMILMRSKWEVAFAQYLDRHGMKWEYEPRFFFVGVGVWRGLTYLPDFYLPTKDMWIDVKGRYSDENKAKIAEFRNRNPKKHLLVIEKQALRRIGVINKKDEAILKRRTIPVELLG